MAAEIGTQTARLKDSGVREQLAKDPWSFEFFQAVALLQRLTPGASPVGTFPKSPSHEAVHFRVNPRMGFPASQIQGLEMTAEAPAEMTVNFMGLTGPSGVLPYPYSELILERARARDSTLADFFDVFNNRLIALFFRAWQRSRFPVTYSREGTDHFTHYLFDLLGLGTPGLRDRQEIEDDALLHYVSLLSMQARSAAALEQIAADYFEVPVEVQQFTGAWYTLNSDTQCSVGAEESASARVGAGAIVGDAVWDCQARVRLRIGPLSLERYREFLPDGGSYAALRSLVRFYTNNTVDFEVQLILEREQVPAIELDFDSANAAQLGWVSWTRTRPLTHHPEDTILTL
jgi:type VI secretion system protein ImpH